MLMGKPIGVKASMRLRHSANLDLEIPFALFNNVRRDVVYLYDDHAYSMAYCIRRIVGCFGNLFIYCSINVGEDHKSQISTIVLEECNCVQAFV